MDCPSGNQLHEVLAGQRVNDLGLDLALDLDHKHTFLFRSTSGLGALQITDLPALCVPFLAGPEHKGLADIGILYCHVTLPSGASLRMNSIRSRARTSANRF